MTDKHELVGDLLAHTLLGVQMLSRENPDWDGAESYGGRLHQTAEHLRAAQESYRLAEERRQDDEQRC